jgi:hypothetical protein
VPRESGTLQARCAWKRRASACDEQVRLGFPSPRELTSTMRSSTGGIDHGLLQLGPPQATVLPQPSWNTPQSPV